MSSDDYTHGTMAKQKRGFVHKLLDPQVVSLIAVVTVIFGSWLNAQGGWVKDFSYNKMVTLPFLNHNYYTSGFDWYLVGLLDDLAGFSGNIIGLVILKKLGFLSTLGRVKYPVFVVSIAVYLVLDMLAFRNFSNYYSGNLSLSLYGQYWNIVQYFGMLPAFFVTDFLILVWKDK